MIENEDVELAAEVEAAEEVAAEEVSE